MNKKFFVVGAAIFATSVALSDINLIDNADGFKVDIGSDIFFETGTRIQNKKYRLYPITKNNSDVGFNSASSMHLSLKQRLQNAWQVGLQLGLTTSNLTK